MGRKYVVRLATIIFLLSNLVANYAGALNGPSDGLIRKIFSGKNLNERISFLGISSSMSCDKKSKFLFVVTENKIQNHGHEALGHVLNFYSYDEELSDQKNPFTDKVKFLNSYPLQMSNVTGYFVYDDRIVFIVSGIATNIMVFTCAGNGLKQVNIGTTRGQPELIGDKMMLFAGDYEPEPVSIYQWNGKSYELRGKSKMEARYRWLSR